RPPPLRTKESSRSSLTAAALVITAKSRRWPMRPVKLDCSFNLNPGEIVADQAKDNLPPGRGSSRGGGRQGGGRRGRPMDAADKGIDGKENSDLSEKVVFINRSAKVVKGGRRFSFSALVVVGDKQGKVGLGLGKAGEVADAIRKGGDDAKHNMLNVSLKDTTIPHEVFSEYGGARILLRPASPGTGIIAGKTVRAVVESAGVKDILSK